MKPVVFEAEYVIAKAALCSTLTTEQQELLDVALEAHEDYFVAVAAADEHELLSALAAQFGTSRRTLLAIAAQALEQQLQDVSQ